MNDLLKSIQESEALVNRLISENPPKWDITNKSYFSIKRKIWFMNEFWDLTNLGEQLVKLKRSGMYAECINGYVNIIKSCIEEIGKIPVRLLRNYMKVLISLNAFCAAHSLAESILLLMIDAPDADQEDYNSIYIHWKNIGIISISNLAELRNDILGYCADCSGNPNYTFVKDYDDILSDFKQIREHVIPYADALMH